MSWPAASPPYRPAARELDELTARLRSVLDISRLPSLSPEQSFEEPRSPPPASPAGFARLPLFSRCPFTNEAQLYRGQELPPARPPLLASGGPGDLHRGGSWGLHRAPGLAVRRPWPSNDPPVSPPLAGSKPSLDSVLCTSQVALTNKQGEGKYWFKSGCPTPDPRWPAGQQLMIGPIPGDVDYAELRAAFLAHGHTCHLFIQNNQAWLERNQEKFGPRQVKFGYVVYSEAGTAGRLNGQGSVLVRRASGQRCQVRVKWMDGQPAQFHRS